MYLKIREPDTLTLLFFVFFAVVSLKADQGVSHMKIFSPQFKDNQFIPKAFSCEGQDINPSLEIKDIPPAAKSLVLIVDDPDAPMGTWTHWVAFDIPPQTKLIKENSIPGKQAKNSLNQENYHGPCPPSGTHRYFFKIYALDTLLGLEEGVKRSTVEKAMQGHILDKAELVGLYKRG
jgi:Raf kinase inhibitor-like YbhB/YbcL family protein